MNRSLRLALTALLIGLVMMVDTRPAFSSNGIVSDVIVCANEIGETREFQVGWDPTNLYFEGKGDIPRLFCEGGHAGSNWMIFVSSTLAIDDPRRYYNGVIPVPEPSVEPTVEPTPSMEPEPTPLPSLSPEPTIEPTPTPTEPTQIEPTPELPPEPSPTPSQSIEQEIVPIPAPTPSISITAEPTPTPTPSLTDEPSPTPIPSAPSQSEPTPTPTITQQVSIELSPTVAAIPGALQLVAAAEAIMNIGADMTDEERQEAQTVAVSALIVTQLAQVRKIK